jgi:hypothetical protein
MFTQRRSCVEALALRADCDWNVDPTRLGITEVFSGVEAIPDRGHMEWLGRK